MKNVDKSSSAGTEVESSTNADSSQVCQPIAKHSVSRCFSRSDDEFTFSEKGFHGSLLSNIMSGIRDLTSYNIYDENKKPLKVVGIQLNKGNLHVACYIENGEQRYIYTGYLAVLNNG
jgi:hypothetical protein